MAVELDKAQKKNGGKREGAGRPRKTSILDLVTETEIKNAMRVVKAGQMGLEYTPVDDKGKEMKDEKGKELKITVTAEMTKNARYLLDQVLGTAPQREKKRDTTDDDTRISFRFNLPPKVNDMVREQAAEMIRNGEIDTETVLQAISQKKKPAQGKDGKFKKVIKVTKQVEQSQQGKVIPISAGQVVEEKSGETKEVPLRGEVNSAKGEG